MRILAILIYYNGNAQSVNNNIRAFIDYVDKLVIWENSSVSDKEAILFGMNTDKVIFRGTGKNVGISKALNIVINTESDEYDYILTMDQDSIWINVEEYLTVIKETDRNKIFAFGPSVIISERNINTSSEKIIDADHVITSGALIKVEYLKQLGGYCEALWIDGIDEDVCFRAREQHYDIKKICSAYLLQQYGSGNIKKIGKRSFIVPAYNANRKYGIAKNHVYIIKKYELSIYKKMEMINEYIVKPIIDTVFFEDNKCRKLKAIIRGVIDGLKWKVD